MSQSDGKPALRVVLVVVLVVVAFGAGVWARGCMPAKSQGKEKAQLWTCSMHPFLRLPRAGKCPICHMDLIPLESLAGQGAGESNELVLSPHAEALAQVETAPVERKLVSAVVRMVGKVDYDETRLGTISARVPGRLDRLYVDYRGIAVRKGDHLFSLYSPDLLTAQQELLQTLNTVRELEKTVAGSDALTSARLTLDAVREKLRLWDLTPEQIADMEARGTASDHITIYAPLGGIVIAKHAVEGSYVQTGMPVYTIADLSQVWVKLDAYESDIAFVRYGQHVTFETESYAGDRFQGTIAFIDPVLDEKTRTVKVRVNVPNPQGKLKPGMFVHGLVHAELAAGGRVIDRDLAGKWICPMHPEVVEDGPGMCGICGMPLVTAESLGYVSPEGEKVAPLVVPASAALVTGKRAVVYVAVSGKEGVYAGREIVLGPRAGDFYLVDSGLAEGEQVVVNGNFKIDSAVELRAGPSMMTAGDAHTPGGEATVTPPAGAGTTAAEVPGSFKAELDAVYASYFAVEDALSKDDAAQAKAAAGDLTKALDAVKTDGLEEPALSAWRKDRERLAKSAADVAAAADLIKAREAFAPLSDAVYSTVEELGASGAQGIWRFHCPMAFEGAGAYWLQNSGEPANPYFGSVMLTCHDDKQGLVAPATPTHEDQTHE